MTNENKLFLENKELKMKDEEKILRYCGLTQNEIKIFLTLLKSGSTSVGKITEQSGVHRRNVYDALDRLSEKGLVGNAVKDNIKVFEVTSPNRLLDIVRKEKERYFELESKINSVLPKLLMIKNLSSEKQDVKIYRGTESRRVIFEDIIQNAKQNMVLGAHSPSKSSINYLRSWHKRRIKAGIKDRLIYCRPGSYAKELSSLPLTEIRFLPKQIRTQTAINIYENKVAILFWSNDKPISILIDSKKVYEDFKHYFNFLWRISKQSVS